MLKQNIKTNFPYKMNALTTLGKMLGVMTFFTVLSQLPQIVNAGYSSMLSRVIWIFGAAVVILYSKRVFIAKQFAGAFLMAITLFVFSFVQFLTVKTSFVSSLSSCILLSIFVLFVSLMFGCHITGRDLKLIARCYVIASTIMAIDLLFTTLRNVDLSSSVYAYASKNSAGVILFTGFVLALVYGFKRRKRLNNVLNLGIIALHFLVVLFLKTRAMIVCFPIVLVLYICFSPFSKKTKAIIIFVAFAAMLFLLNEKVYDIIVNQILFNNKDLVNDDISSGRFDQWAALGENLRNTWLIGDGKTEQESLILTALIQYGIFMGAYIILYAFWPLAFSLGKIKQIKNKHIFCLLCISAVYFIDAIFEQLAPFGPGVRCFYLWLLFGVILSNNKLLAGEEYES